MFWGLALKANKRYSQKVSRAFHVSHAALDVNSSAEDPVQVVITCDGCSYILCTLRKGKIEHASLDLNFAEGEHISFTSQGDGNVHLVGYFLPGPSDRSESGSISCQPNESSCESIAEGSSDPEETVKTKKSSKLNLLNGNSSVSESNLANAGQKLTLKNQSKVMKSDQDHSDDSIHSKKRKKSEKALKGGVRIIDLVEGNGMEAKPGKKVEVYYEGRLQSNKKLFDSNKSGSGLRFVLGRGEVIKGWDLGVMGMKVGGKRKIICPPNMAYGVKGLPPTIPANATLVFEVEVRAIK